MKRSAKIINSIGLALCCSIFIVACDREHSPAYNKRIYDNLKSQSEKYLPKQSTNRTYLDGGWWTFMLNGECFMYGKGVHSDNRKATGSLTHVDDVKFCFNEPEKTYEP